MANAIHGNLFTSSGPRPTPTGLGGKERAELQRMLLELSSAARGGASKGGGEKDSFSRTPRGVDGAESPARLGNLNDSAAGRELAGKDAIFPKDTDELEARIRTSFSRMDRGDRYVTDPLAAKKSYMKHLEENLKRNGSHLSVKSDPSEPGSFKIMEDRTWPRSDTTRTVDLRGKSTGSDPISSSAQGALDALRSDGISGAFRFFERTDGIMGDPAQAAKVVDKFGKKVAHDPQLSRQYGVAHGYDQSVGEVLLLTDKRTGTRHPFAMGTRSPLDRE